MVPVKRSLVALLLLAGCAHAPPGGGEESIAEGMASYYGEGFRGRLTANGEKFDPDALTAAHRTLPFGTCLRVESIGSGRSVRVRVNDRGPYAGGRIIDLSEAAARALDMLRTGVARVRLFHC
jgi:rare lipoprotein A